MVGFFDMGLSFDGYGEMMDKFDIRPIIPCAGVLEDNVSESNQDLVFSGRACGYKPGGVSFPDDLLCTCTYIALEFSKTILKLKIL